MLHHPPEISCVDVGPEENKEKSSFIIVEQLEVMLIICHYFVLQISMKN